MNKYFERLLFKISVENVTFHHQNYIRLGNYLTEAAGWVDEVCLF